MTVKEALNKIEGYCFYSATYGSHIVVMNGDIYKADMEVLIKEPTIDQVKIIAKEAGQQVDLLHEMHESEKLLKEMGLE